MEYVDGMSVFRGYFILDEMDPTGEVKIKNVGQIKKPNCANIYGKQEYKFQLSKRWPCRGAEGYFVQEVSVHCLLCNCDAHSPCVKEDYIYWEAWGVSKDNLYAGNVMTAPDTAEFWTNYPRSSYTQHGTVKFYCVTPPGLVPKVGEISRPEVEWKPIGSVKPGSACDTTTSELPRTLTRPTWWDRESADPPVAGRAFLMNWNCCCKGLRYAQLKTRPE